MSARGAARSGLPRTGKPRPPAVHFHAAPAFVGALAGTTLLAALLPGPARGETQFHFDGQVRVRLVASDTTFQEQPENWEVLERARLGLSAQVSENVRAYIQVQDSRLFGDATNTLSDEESADVRQAYAEIQHAWSGTRLRLRAGRQQLSYGNERLVGAADWDNVGRDFDAVQARLEHGGWSFDVSGARLLDTPQSDDLVLSYNRYAIPHHEVAAEFYAMYRDDESGKFETTLGEHVAGTLRRLRFDHEFAAMLGRRSGQDLEAFLFSTQLHVRLAARGSPTLGAGFDFLSGDGDPADGEFRFFDVRRIFHTGHKFYGILDVAERLAGPAGLLDPYGSVSVQGPRRLRGAASLHVFHLAEPAGFAPGAAMRPTAERSYLGTEIDATLLVSIATQTQLEIGGGVFFPGENLEETGRGATGSWAYLQATLDF